MWCQKLKQTISHGITSILYKNQITIIWFHKYKDQWEFVFMEHEVQISVPYTSILVPGTLQLSIMWTMSVMWTVMDCNMPASQLLHSMSYGKRSNNTQLTNRDRDKMATILPTTFSNAFSRLKIYEFPLKFLWVLFLRVQLTIFQYWFR